jgi:hypothetical protein
MLQNLGDKLNITEDMTNDKNRKKMKHFFGSMYLIRKYRRQTRRMEVQSEKKGPT